MTPHAQLYFDGLDAHLDRNEQEEINADSGQTVAHREIKLTKGYVALVDAGDYERLARHTWQAMKVANRVYAFRQVGNSRKPGRRGIFMHREIMGAEHGEEIDHREGIGLDNRKKNLRRCTHQQNLANQGPHVNNACGKKGVYARNGRWRVQLKVCGRKIHLGTFDDLDLAAAAYLAKAREVFGEFARN